MINKEVESLSSGLIPDKKLHAGWMVSDVW